MSCESVFNKRHDAPLFVCTMPFVSTVSQVFNVLPRSVTTAVRIPPLICTPGYIPDDSALGYEIYMLFLDYC